MPLPTALPRTPVRTRRPSPGVLVLVALAFVLAAVASVVGHAASVAALAAATVVLGVASVAALRTQWAAALPVGPRSAPAAGSARPIEPGGEELTERLRELHAEHVEKVNSALDEGRDDLAQELADAYADQALALITGR